MEKIDAQLPAWIATHASLGDHVDLEDNIEFSPNERFWYHLTLFCPLIFEQYAIVLHPFWNRSLKIGKSANDNETEQYDYSPINWHKFFQEHNRELNLKDALTVKDQIASELEIHGRSKSVTFPAEGDVEKSQIQKIRDVLVDEYGNIEVNYYYVILKTQQWETDITYRGRLSELESLWLLDDVRDNPSAIYPDNKEWCIVTNYDCDVTYIGGTKELIKSLTSLDQCDIYEIEPKQAK
jgi:hypothetical protein